MMYIGIILLSRYHNVASHTRNIKLGMKCDVFVPYYIRKSTACEFRHTHLWLHFWRWMFMHMGKLFMCIK